MSVIGMLCDEGQGTPIKGFPQAMSVRLIFLPPGLTGQDADVDVWQLLAFSSAHQSLPSDPSLLPAAAARTDSVPQGVIRRQPTATAGRMAAAGGGSDNGGTTGGPLLTGSTFLLGLLLLVLGDETSAIKDWPLGFAPTPSSFEERFMALRGGGGSAGDSNGTGSS